MKTGVQVGFENGNFDTHPKLDYYFETADGSCFFTENAAEAHSKTLEDKKVKAVYNEALKKKASSEPAEPKAEPVEPVEPVVEPAKVEPVVPAVESAKVAPVVEANKK